MGKPLGNLCMHVVGKSKRRAAFCLASVPRRGKQSLKLILCCWIISPLSHLAASLLFSLGGITFEAEIQPKAWAAALHPCFSRHKRSPSPAAVLSHYLGTKDSALQKEYGSQRGSFPCFITHRIPTDVRVNRKAEQVPAGAKREQNKSSDARKDLECSGMKGRTT